MLLFVDTRFAVQKAAQHQVAALPPAGPAGNAGSLHGGTGKPASAKQMWVVPQIEPEEEGAAIDSAAAAAAAVSHLCACIGSPCLRQCVHGASIGGGGGGGHSTTGRGLQRQLLGVWLCVGVESATGQPL
eukprot:COSAG06_NODE_17756_length_923_cov_0.759709_1_plen_129_part_10